MRAAARQQTFGCPPAGAESTKSALPLTNLRFAVGRRAALDRLPRAAGEARKGQCEEQLACRCAAWQHGRGTAVAIGLQRDAAWRRAHYFNRCGVAAPTHRGKAVQRPGRMR